MGDIIDLFEKAKCNSAQQILNECKVILTVEDYEEVLCSIMDKKYYVAIEEPDIRAIVDNYFELL